ARLAASVASSCSWTTGNGLGTLGGFGIDARSARLGLSGAATALSAPVGAREITLPDDPGGARATADGMMNTGRAWCRSSSSTKPWAANDTTRDTSHRKRDVHRRCLNTGTSLTLLLTQDSIGCERDA